MQITISMTLTIFLLFKCNEQFLGAGLYAATSNEIQELLLMKEEGARWNSFSDLHAYVYMSD